MAGRRTVLMIVMCGIEVVVTINVSAMSRVCSRQWNGHQRQRQEQQTCCSNENTQFFV
jgi:hypothetical protein